MYGGTVLTEDNADPRMMTNSPYNETMEYINGFKNTTVTVINRHGIAIKIPPNPPSSGAYNDKFVIRRQIVIDPYNLGAVVASVMRFDPNHNETPDVIKCFRKHIDERGMPVLINNRFHVNLDTVVRIGDFKKHSGTMYSMETDLVLSMLNNHERILHPNSAQGLLEERMRQENPDENLGKFIYKIELVDNHGIYGKRFIRIAGEVYSINPIRDHVRRSGVYVTRNDPTIGSTYLSEIRETFYTVEDAEQELLLFRSYEQAKAEGDVAAQRKKEMADIEHETTRLKMEANKKAVEDKLAPDMLKKIIEIIKPMSVILISLIGGIKLIYSLGKSAGASGLK